jgi:hypothetical protein
LLSDEEKLANSLDYLHIQKVKAQQRLKLAEVKAALPPIDLPGRCASKAGARWAHRCG